LLAQLLETVSRGGDCVWLVPEPYSHATERLLAERGGASVCLRAEVLTFRRLVDRVLAAAGGLASPVLDAGGRLLMLRRAVGSVLESLTVLRAAAQKPAFLPELLKTFDECQCYNITPADLERAASEDEPKLRDLALLFGAFERQKERLDTRDRVTLAWERAKTLSAFPCIFVSGFASFTPQERLLLTALAERAPAFTVLFHGALQGELFAPLRVTAKQLASRFPQNGKHVTVDEETVPNWERSLQTLLRQPAAPDELAVARCPLSVELYSAAGEAEEVRFAAERIVRLARDEGLRWRDIVVLASDYSAYAPLIESIFPQYGIPFFSDGMDTPKPLPRCIRAVADCLTYGFRAADVTRLLRTGLLPTPPEDADLMEDYLRRWNPRGNRFSGGRDWTRSPEGYGEPDERALAELVRLNLLRRQIASGVKMLRGKTARQCAEGLYAALEALGVPAGMAAREKALSEAGEPKLANEVSQMWELFCRTLEQCVLVLGEAPTTPADFCELCLTVLSGYSVGSIPAALDRVHTGDQGRLARIPVPVVLYLGADSERVPARGGADGLLSGEERAALAGIGCELPPDPPARIGREQYNLFTALALPQKKLIGSYPLSGGSSADCIERLSRAYSVPVVPVPPPTLPADPAEVSGGPLSGANTAALYGKTLYLSASRLEAFYLCPFSYFVRYGLNARRRPEPGFTPLDVGRELHLILERCARYAKERGGFGHITRQEMLDFAVNEASARLNAMLSDTPRLLAQGERLAKTAGMLAGRLWEEFTNSRFAPLDFELALTGRETPLPGVPPGAPSSYIPRGIADRIDGWRRDGTLYLRVVDYKTGGKAFSLTDVYHGVGAQMPFYLTLTLENAAERYGAETAEAAGAFYVPSRDVAVRSSKPLSPEEARLEAAAALRHKGLVLDDPGVLEAMDSRLYSADGTLPVSFNRDGSLAKKTLAASPEQMRLLQGHIRKLTRGMARSVAGGTVEARPLGLRDSPCDRCDCRAACQFDSAAGSFRAVTAFSGREEFFGAL
jgi:ATP-dependent helicase/nuclease subunit B